MPTYDVVFWNDTYKDNRFVVAKGLTSLVDARNKRQQSGDLVIFSGTDEVVKNPAWLWDWEKANPNSYARRYVEDTRSALNKDL